MDNSVDPRLKSASCAIKIPISISEQLIDAAAGLTWQPVDTVGEGIEHRAESSRGDQASALVMDNVIVHGNILAAV